MPTLLGALSVREKLHERGDFFDNNDSTKGDTVKWLVPDDSSRQVRIYGTKDEILIIDGGAVLTDKEKTQKCTKMEDGFDNDDATNGATAK